MSLPTGTVTFLFSDVEGSTRRLEHDQIEAGRALASHHEIFRGVVAANHGVIFETVGDAVYAAFRRSSDAAVAAVAAHRALADHDWNGFDPLLVRIAIHTGEVEARGRHYFGAALFRCARLQALGWGGQTLISGATERLLAGRVIADASLRDRGIHQLKDLTDPEHVFELFDPATGREFPTLRSTAAHPHNLPEQLSTFVGRESELAALETLVQAHPLVTVLGPGGTGKTRLVLEVAGRLVDEMPDGAWFVDLAPVRRPEAVAAAIASVLSVQEQPPAPLIDTVREHLQAKRLVLVLDNFEQVMEAAQAVGSLVGGHDVRVVVTSREPLRLRGEQEFPLSPLAITSSEAGVSAQVHKDSPSVRLFVDRAKEVLPSYELTDASVATVAAICRRLDGLPLAIELAAALIGLLSPEQMLRRLSARLDLVATRNRDLPERQRTLRAALSWSYDLLDAAEQGAFRGLAVFADGFTLAAAAEVLGDAGPDILSLVGALLDKSLLIRSFDAQGDSRFRMLETVREFALERLRESTDDERRGTAFALWALRIVTTDGAALRWTEASARLPALELERGNVVEAIRRLDDAGRHEALVELVSAMSSFWLAGGHLSEARPWLDRAVEVLRPPATAVTARLFRNAASIEHQLGGSARSLMLIERSIAVWAEIGDDAGRADALRLRGAFLLDRGDTRTAYESLSEAATIARRVGDDMTRRACLADLGAIAIQDGDAALAHRLFEELLDASTVAGDRFGIAMAHGNLSPALALLGDLTTAEAEAREAVRLFSGTGEIPYLGWSLLNLAEVIAEAGRPDEAREVAIRALRMLSAVGVVKEISSCLDVLAGIALATDDLARCVRLMVAAGRMRTEAELALDGADKTRVAAREARVREALGDEFEPLSDAAMSVPIDEIVREELSS